jgi:hypothetical protein
VTNVEQKRNKISLTHKGGKKESVDIEATGTMNDKAHAAEWLKVILAIRSEVA